MFLAISMTFWSHLGLGLGVGTRSGYGYGSNWISCSIPRTYSTWSSTLDYESKTLMETLQYGKGLGRMILPFLSNGSWFH